MSFRPWSFLNIHEYKYTRRTESTLCHSHLLNKYLIAISGTSSPEFFTNVISTFIAESDLGIGTIVGSAVFNIFGVIAVCGLFAGKKIPLDWYEVDKFARCLRHLPITISF